MRSGFLDVKASKFNIEPNSVFSDVSAKNDRASANVKTPSLGASRVNLHKRRDASSVTPTRGKTHRVRLGSHTVGLRTVCRIRGLETGFTLDVARVASPFAHSNVGRHVQNDRPGSTPN